MPGGVPKCGLSTGGRRRLQKAAGQDWVPEGEGVAWPGQAHLCWPVQEPLAITNGIGHCGWPWPLQKLLVLAEGGGHFRWPWSLQKALTIAEAVGPCRSCWPLQVAFTTAEALGPCRRCWSLQKLLVLAEGVGRHRWLWSLQKVLVLDSWGMPAGSQQAPGLWYPSTMLLHQHQAPM